MPYGFAFVYELLENTRYFRFHLFPFLVVGSFVIWLLFPNSSNNVSGSVHDAKRQTQL